MLLPFDMGDHLFNRTDGFKKYFLAYLPLILLLMGEGRLLPLDVLQGIHLDRGDIMVYQLFFEKGCILFTTFF